MHIGCWVVMQWMRPVESNMGNTDKIVYAALRGLVIFLGVMAIATTAVWSVEARAGAATYVDCYFDPEQGGEAKPWGSGIVLRFMLNLKLELAFRIDTAVARPVLLYVEEDGSFTLLDYHATTDVIMITVRRNGQSMYSRHRLIPPPGTDDTMGSQRIGRCGEPEMLAYMRPAIPWISRPG